MHNSFHTFVCYSTVLHKISKIYCKSLISFHIFYSMHGPGTETEWSIEGRRLVSLTPRLVPQTAFTAKASHSANAVAGENSKLTLKKGNPLSFISIICLQGCVKWKVLSLSQVFIYLAWCVKSWIRWKDYQKLLDSGIFITQYFKLPFPWVITIILSPFMRQLVWLVFLQIKWDCFYCWKLHYFLFINKLRLN